MEKYHEEQRPRGSETGSRARTTGRQGATNKPRSPRQAKQDISADIQIMYEAQASAIHEHYPNTQVWYQPEGLWLLTESQLIPDLQQKAKFLTWIPFSNELPVRSWGFWESNSLFPPTWIGPRHTNYDGSICAFEPKDNTWVYGDPIIDLFDFYTLWALRHLHLQVFGRWPGEQMAHDHYERLTEFRGDEGCGCGESTRLYSECCYLRDLKLIKGDHKFISLLAAGEQRTAPKEVKQFICGEGKIPLFRDILIRQFQKLIEKKVKSPYYYAVR